MRKILFTVFAVLFMVGCESKIDLEEAISIAQSNANVSESAVVESSSYADDKYTIIFTDNGYRYTYVVDDDGEIESFTSEAYDGSATTVSDTTTDSTSDTTTATTDTTQSTTTSGTGTITDYVSQDILDTFGIDTTLIENYSVREEADDGTLYRIVYFTINSEKYEFKMTTDGVLAKYEYESANGIDGDYITVDDAKTIAATYMGTTSDQVTWYDIDQDDDYQYELEGLFGDELVEFEIYYNGTIGKVDYEYR